MANHPKLAYNRHKGYTANAWRFAGTAPPTKGTLAQDAHAMPTGIKIHFTRLGVTNRQINAAASRGKRQYPSRQRDWKKPIVPPSKTTLTVRMIAPMETRPNTNCCREENAGE